MKYIVWQCKCGRVESTYTRRPLMKLTLKCKGCNCSNILIDKRGAYAQRIFYIGGDREVAQETRKRMATLVKR